MWGPEQEEVLQQVQAAVQVALLLGQFGPADTMVLKVSVAEREAVEASDRPLYVNLSTGL